MTSPEKEMGLNAIWMTFSFYSETKEVAAIVIYSCWTSEAEVIFLLMPHDRYFLSCVSLSGKTFH